MGRRRRAEAMFFALARVLTIVCTVFVGMPADALCVITAGVRPFGCFLCPQVFFWARCTVRAFSVACLPECMHAYSCLAVACGFSPPDCCESFNSGGDGSCGVYWEQLGVGTKKKK